ncbi:hypothetical protein [Ruminococcus sp.]|uniref:hypothetical protein n=1 Tax=Ruminococcus sp. TaxID=41978 RepID=UPI00388E38EA
MANTKRNANTPENKENTKKTETPYDPWADTVSIKIPKDRNKKEDVTVSINDKSFLIQRGVEVDVPRPVYDALVDQERAIEERDAYIEENASE